MCENFFLAGAYKRGNDVGCAGDVGHDEWARELAVE